MLVRPSRLGILLAGALLFPLVPAHALGQTKGKKSTTSTKVYKPEQEVKLTCPPGHYKCSDSFGNCCKVGWACTADGLCAPPGAESPSGAGAGAGGGGSTSKKTKGVKAYNNEGSFSASDGAGSDTSKPSGKLWVPKNANIAQWPGFRMTADGGSEVVVEFSKATTAPTEAKAAGSLTYVFTGPVLSKTNNLNPLITMHFNTPVLSARLVPKGKQLLLHIELRAGVSAAPSFGVRPGEGGGGQQFFVKFPSGEWLPKGADDEAGPAASAEKPAPPSKKPSVPKPTATGDTKSDSGSQTGPTP